MVSRRLKLFLQKNIGELEDFGLFMGDYGEI